MGAAWTAVHHAFTSPTPSDRFEEDPGAALAYAYDIVCNGNGARRRLDPYPSARRPERVFEVMGITEQAQEKFGFLLDGVSVRRPPHGGIAFGWDRARPCSSGPTRSAR